MEAFAALADPTRRQIVELLAEGERSVGDVVAAFCISQPAISRHLRRLREAGLVSCREEGARRVYRLEARGISEVESWLRERRSTWERRFDALERQLAEAALGDAVPAEGALADESELEGEGAMTAEPSQ